MINERKVVKKKSNSEWVVSNEPVTNQWGGDKGWGSAVRVNEGETWEWVRVGEESEGRWGGCYVVKWEENEGRWGG